MAKKPEATMTETLRQFIRDSGLSLYRVAKDSKISYATLFRFMTNERSVSARTLDKLCTMLGLALTKK